MTLLGNWKPDKVKFYRSPTTTISSTWKLTRVWSTGTDHTATCSCHLKRPPFLWLFIDKDVKQCALVLPFCIKRQSSDVFPSGLLKLLPVPNLHWSRTAFGIFIGLSRSESNNTVVNMTISVSKAVHFISNSDFLLKCHNLWFKASLILYTI